MSGCGSIGRSALSWLAHSRRRSSSWWWRQAATPVDRTIEQLEGIQHAVGPGLAAIPGTNRIFQSGPDAQHNRIVYVTDRISDAMLHALAARFGTEALAVRIDRNPRIGY